MQEKEPPPHSLARSKKKKKKTRRTRWKMSPPDLLIIHTEYTPCGSPAAIATPPLRLSTPAASRHHPRRHVKYSEGEGGEKWKELFGFLDLSLFFSTFFGSRFSPQKVKSKSKESPRPKSPSHSHSRLPQHRRAAALLPSNPAGRRG
jgi:hypothetical protein